MSYTFSLHSTDFFPESLICFYTHIISVSCSGIQFVKVILPCSLVMILSTFMHWYTSVIKSALSFLLFIHLVYILWLFFVIFIYSIGFVIGFGYDSMQFMYSSQSELRLPLLQVVSNNKSFSVGVQSPTEINAPRGCAVILRRICQLSLTRITHQVSHAFDLKRRDSANWKSAHATKCFKDWMHAWHAVPSRKMGKSESKIQDKTVGWFSSPQRA